MFEKTPSSAPGTVPVTPASQTGDDIVVHAMPREFYGKEASVLDSAQPKTAVSPPPVAAPKPVVVPPPVVAQKPVASSQGPVKKSHAWIGTVIVTLVFLGILGVGGYFAYQRVTESQEREAQLAIDLAELEAEKEAQRLADEEEANRPVEPTPGTDTDSDGLTDVEEPLYGTDPRDPDSDEDTFLDGNEVFHGYHPLGLAPSTLLDTGTVKNLEEPTYPYTVYYPTTWSVALDRQDFGVVFASNRQASISVHWEVKSADETLSQWFDGQEDDVDADDMKETMTKAGYYGLVADDDRMAYLDVGNAVAILTYDLGDKPQIEYLQTFQMMVNSFTLRVVE